MIIITCHNAWQNSTGASRLGCLLPESSMDWHSSPGVRTVATATECRSICGCDAKGDSEHLDLKDDPEMPRRLCIDCQLQRTDQRICRESPSSRDAPSISCTFSLEISALLSLRRASLQFFSSTHSSSLKSSFVLRMLPRSWIPCVVFCHSMQWSDPLPVC